MALDATVGGADADTYATLAEYQARAADFGWSLSGTDATDEVNLRKGALAIERYSFVGVRASSTQAREFPRSYVSDTDSESIPQAIKDAQMEMAYLIQGGADPFATIDGMVKIERKKADVLEIETEYFGGKGRESYPGITSLLRRYLTSGPGQVGMVRG